MFQTTNHAGTYIPLIEKTTIFPFPAPSPFSQGDQVSLSVKRSRLLLLGEKAGLGDVGDSWDGNNGVDWVGRMMVGMMIFIKVFRVVLIVVNCGLFSGW